jgi:hypothetical protein
MTKANGSWLLTKTLWKWLDDSFRLRPWLLDEEPDTTGGWQTRQRKNKILPPSGESWMRNRLTRAVGESKWEGEYNTGG